MAFAAAARLAVVLSDALRIAAHRGRELHHGRRPLRSRLAMGGALVEAARQQRPLQPPPVLRNELRRRRDAPTARARDGRRRVVRAARRRLPALAAARARDERPQRRRLEHHLELAVAHRRIERHDDRLDLRQREREDHEVGDVAEHEPDPRAGADAHRVQLLGAPVDAVQQPSPGQVRVPVDEGFAATAIRRDVREP